MPITEFEQRLLALYKEAVERNQMPVAEYLLQALEANAISSDGPVESQPEARSQPKPSYVR